jgi:DNA-binding NarL/FixJ family response regulator
VKVYILDNRNRNLKEIKSWLADNKDITGIEVFSDYTRMLLRIEEVQPAMCIIRLGEIGIPGFMTARTIKSLHPDIRIVFVSEYSSYALDAYELGAYGYVLYPADREKFERFLKNRGGI